MWNRYKNNNTLAHSLTYYIHNGPVLPPPPSPSLTKISAIVVIFRKFVPKTMRWWNRHATKLEFHFYIHSSCITQWNWHTHSLSHAHTARATTEDRYRWLLIYATFVKYFPNLFRDFWQYSQTNLQIITSIIIAVGSCEIVPKMDTNPNLRPMSGKMLKTSNSNKSLTRSNLKRMTSIITWMFPRNVWN